MKGLLRRLVQALPERLEEKVLRVWRFRRHWRRWVRRLRLRFSASGTVTRYLSDDTVFWVDPGDIVFAMNSEGFHEDGEAPPRGGYREFGLYEYRGRVLGGDWDRLDKRFSDLDFYRTYEERALKGTPWEELPYYQRVSRQIANGIEKWGCTSIEDLDERCRMLDEIFNDVKQNGYKSRVVQREERGRESLFDGDDEIAVNIGRHGDLIFNNGRHRLTFARIAGVERVPVTITVRHSDWEEFKNEIEQYAQWSNGRVYAPLPHIDLQNIPVHYSDARYRMISANLGEGSRTLLDIGSHWGYFCHMFEADGLQCTAVENWPNHLYFLRKLRRAANRDFEIIAESVVTFGRRKPVKYDVVLALAIFHHFLKEKATFQDLQNLLQSMDMREMYFEPHLHDEPQMEGAFVNFTPEEFVDFLLKNSCLTDYELLGKCEEDRPVYKLWRK